eukprot:364990-Chlamydomonas_euryale.AAC.4
MRRLRPAVALRSPPFTSAPLHAPSGKGPVSAPCVHTSRSNARTRARVGGGAPPTAAAWTVPACAKAGGEPAQESANPHGD